MGLDPPGVCPFGSGNVLLPQSLARFVPSCEAEILLACLVFFAKGPLWINWQLTDILDCLITYCLPSGARFSWVELPLL